MAIIYQCNICADTENMVAPCTFKVSTLLGEPNPTVCPVSGDEAEWIMLTSEEFGGIEIPNKGKNTNKEQ